MAAKIVSSYPNHPGRTGQRGGSLPKSEGQGGGAQEQSFSHEDRVKVTGNVSGRGQVGKVIEVSPSRKYYTVRFDNGETRSYHGSDLSLHEDEGKEPNIQSRNAIECRAAVEISPTATNEILFLPIGLHAIMPVEGGIGRPIKVKVGPESAQMIEQQRAALVNKGKRPYFDFNHEDGPASFWPESFAWRSGDGVIAKGEWSRRGKSAVEGKDFRAFSPVFHVDNKRAEAALVVCNDTAAPNMGGLVNNPAFQNLAVWSKNDETLVNAGATGDNADTERKTMEDNAIAALRAKQQELQSEIDAMKGSAATTENESRQSLAETELRAVHAEIEVEELRAENARNKGIIQARNHANAEAAVKSAMQRGAILPKDTQTQKSMITRAAADPSYLTDIAAMQGPGNQLSTRLTGYSGGVTVTAEAPTSIYAAMAKLLGTSARGNREDKCGIAREFSAIYSRELSPVTAANSMRNLSVQLAEIETIIKAADVTDTDLGTLSGTLVTQRTLELLKFTFPALSMFTTDFSAESAQFNQTIMTRTVDVPNVTSYNTTTGWSDSTATTNDIPITIDAHRGVNITFNSNILASTVRRLFDEQAPAQAYALGKDMMDDLYANITDANFPQNSVVTTSSFSRSSVIDIGVVLNLQGVPIGPGMRTLILYSTVFGQLEKDAAIVSLGAFQRPEIITGPTQENAAYVIKVSGFSVVDAPNLGTNNANLTGFAGSKSALVIATRVPNDYTAALPGASFGNVQVVTDPDIGISVMLVQYVNHALGTATSRIALMYGTAAGQSLAGMLLKAHTGSGSSRTS